MAAMQSALVTQLSNSNHQSARHTEKIVVYVQSVGFRRVCFGNGEVFFGSFNLLEEELSDR